MNIKKMLPGLVSSVGMIFVTASAAFAQQMTLGGVQGVQPKGGKITANNVFTFSGGPTGAFSVTNGAFFTATDAFGNSTIATLSFTSGSLVNSGFATGSGTTADPYQEVLSGGGFTLASATHPTDVLLTGTFGNGNLLEGNTGGTGSVTNTLTNVHYTGGDFFTSSGYINPGSFAINLTSVHPTLSLSGGYLKQFTAGGGGTFTATSAVPEPSSVAAFAFTGLGMMGLMLRARKARRNTAS